VPKLLVDEDGFRIVADVVSGQDIFTLEKREGPDAMGAPIWRKVETSKTHMVTMLYRFIVHLMTQAEEAQKR
jgi:hypothetical protein